MACAGHPASASELHVAGATLHVQWDAALEPEAAKLRPWIETSARTVAAFYGRFPADELNLRLVARTGDGVRGGVTTNAGGAHIEVGVGTAVTRAQLADDWVLVHEMIHLALPEVGRRHNWLAEGLSTYVEGIARAQSGTRAVTDVWSEFLRAMPRGLPQPGEGGLDETHTWARTYWGGALFCLLADVSIREHSHGRYSLRDALAAILSGTGGYAGPSAPRGVDIDEVLRLGDAATHGSVLADLYARMKQSAEAPDLPALWSRLGVRRDGDGIVFDAHAPLAPLRESMTRAAGPLQPTHAIGE